MQTDYLIIGQGMAGSLLAWQLQERGRRVCVVDAGHDKAASQVGAGLMNPLTGSKLVKSRQVDTLLPRARLIYHQMGKALGESRFHPLPIYRIFKDAGQQQLWQTQQNRYDFTPYLAGHTLKEFDELIHQAYGGVLLRKGGRCDMAGLIADYRKHLHRTDRLIEADFVHRDLALRDDGVAWQGITARSAIFCEGAKVPGNPFFKHLPWRPVKGELVMFRATHLPQTYVLNSGLYIIPMGANTFLAGSTYDRHDRNHAPTPSGKTQLERRLKALLKVPFEITGQSAGIRPGVNDRRPVLGRHPRYPQLAIFNGLGTKAALQAPYLAVQMADYLAHHKPLPQDMDLKRFKPSSLR